MMSVVVAVIVCIGIRSQADQELIGNPHDMDPTMSTLKRLHTQLDSMTRYLTPLLPIANCHMVEFLTHNHWDNLVPVSLRKSLETLSLNDAVDRFWRAVQGDAKVCQTPELAAWVHGARSHCVTTNTDYCLTTEQLFQHITKGSIRPQITVKEFMNPKKSYEVAVLSRLVATLSDATGATCCVEAGGGRGALATSLSLAHGLSALSIDCAPHTETTAAQRAKAMKKAWHALAVTTDENGDTESSPTKVQPQNGNHRFATAFITRSTDVAAIVKEHYPDMGDVKLILTGLHTCGNLGPDSLRIFVSQPSVTALLNVPCCYHLLTEDLDVELFDVFQREYGGDAGVESKGFPMSEYLRGYNLGRNARMLAAQSIDRVVAHKQLPSRTLLYRALLQVLVKTHLPDISTPEGKLKRLSKCHNFQQYFKQADSILNLKLFDKLSHQYIKDFCLNIESRWQELVLFYLIRLCLAQVIESVILLDRLVFLYEQGFQNVFLVKLFDPVLSPRCHSIVAVRK